MPTLEEKQQTFKDKQFCEFLYSNYWTVGCDTYWQFSKFLSDKLFNLVTDEPDTEIEQTETGSFI